MHHHHIYRQAGSALLLAAFLGLLFFLPGKAKSNEMLYQKEPDSFFYVTADNALWRWTEGASSSELIEAGNGGEHSVDYRFKLKQSGDTLYYPAQFSYEASPSGFPLKCRKNGEEKSVLVDEDVCFFYTDNTGNVYYMKMQADFPSSDSFYDLWIFDGRNKKLLGNRIADCYPFGGGQGAVIIDDADRLSLYDNKSGECVSLTQSPADLIYLSEDSQTIIYQIGSQLISHRNGTDENLLSLTENESIRVCETDGELSIYCWESMPFSYKELLLDDVKQKTAGEQSFYDALSDMEPYDILKTSFSCWQERTGEKVLLAEGYSNGWDFDTETSVGCINLAPAADFEKPALSSLLSELRGYEEEDWADAAQRFLDDAVIAQSSLFVFREDRFQKVDNVGEKPYDGSYLKFAPAQELWIGSYYRFSDFLDVYAIDVSKEGFGQETLLASEDSYSARTAYSEDGAYFYAGSSHFGVRDIAMDTLMQAGREQPLDEAEGINIINLKKAVNRPPLLYLTGVQDAAMTEPGTLRCYNGTKAFDLADNIYDFLFYGSAQVAMLQIKDDGRQVRTNSSESYDLPGILHIYENGAYQTLSEDVREIFILDRETAPMTEKALAQTVQEPSEPLSQKAEADQREAASSEDPTGTIDKVDEWTYRGYGISSFDSLIFPVPNGWFVGMNSNSPLLVYRKYDGNESEGLNYDVGSYVMIDRDEFLTGEEKEAILRLKKEDGIPSWFGEGGEWIETDYYTFIKHSLTDSAGELNNVFYMPVGANAGQADVITFFSNADSPLEDTATSLSDELIGSFVFLPYDYQVKKGDTLMGIAFRLTGDATMYRAIAAHNGLRDANLIFPGQLLHIKKEWLAILSR